MNHAANLELWHKFIDSPGTAILDELLDDDVRFHSPFVWKPKEGKHITTAILMTAASVFDEFVYVREISGERDWCLEFEAKVGGLTARGVDLIKFNDAGNIIDFEVMVRPANALEALGKEMSKRLELKKSPNDRHPGS
ncbi:MAG: hypothetical protein KIS76_17335 [Pyrinomonadaceae bacterium]|nr:hypothetical protein [Pyrinomonadaceae bacterium]